MTGGLCSVPAAGSSTWYVNVCCNERPIVRASCEFIELVRQVFLPAQPPQCTQHRDEAGGGEGRGEEVGEKRRGGERAREREEETEKHQTTP